MKIKAAHALNGFVKPRRMKKGERFLPDYAAALAKYGGLTSESRARGAAIIVSRPPSYHAL
jgi:hypothetical protein